MTVRTTLGFRSMNEIGCSSIRDCSWWLSWEFLAGAWRWMVSEEDFAGQAVPFPGPD
jgi:hypothetical protein